MGTQLIKRIELDWQSSFPFAKPRLNQDQAFEHIAQSGGSALVEAPTGSGKTAIGYTYLTALSESLQKCVLNPSDSSGRLVYVTPNKALVSQVQKMHPEVQIALGRNEYKCLCYDGAHQADEVPCSFLVNSGRCGHYVNQETGEPRDPKAEPCSYFKQTWQAKSADGILGCTYAFWIFTHLFNPRQWPKPFGLVLDEVDRIADIARRCLSYEISDWRIERAIKLLEKVGSTQVGHLKSFLRTLNRVVSAKPALEPMLLEDEEIRQLLEKVGPINPEGIRSDLDSAFANGLVDHVADREVLKQIETLIFDMSRYVRSLGFALPKKGERRTPLSYAYAYHKQEPEGREQVQNKVVVCSYFVKPLIRKLFGEHTLAYSAFVGDKEILDYETGVDFPFISLPSQFPPENTRLYIPSDGSNLAYNKREIGDKMQTLQHIAGSTRRFAQRGLRSLLLTVSNEEREELLRLCSEKEGLHPISYGDGVTARQAAERFKAGEGNALIGTLSHYGTGLDLPDQIAPIIFFLRPNWPPPKDPLAQFEVRRAERIKRSHWRVWNWRAGRDCVESRGRNIRGPDDKGVTFFVSGQFKGFLYSVLPGYLESGYHSDLTWKQCENDAMKLLL